MCFSANISRRARARLWVGLAVAGLHLAVIALLVRGFALDFVRMTPVGALQSVRLWWPPPPCKCLPRLSAKQKGGGHSAASPQPSQTQAVPSIPLSVQPVEAAGGDAPTPGVGVAGAGSGAGDGNGTGQGPEKLSGEIRAGDYPAESRALRIGDYVIVALTVGVDGRVRACRVHRASRDAAADAITCRLAQERFRFRPATDAAGHLVEAVFGWRQSWHF